MLGYIIFALFGAWLALLTYFLFQTRSHYFRLIRATNKDQLDDILDFIVKVSKQNSLDLEKLRQEMKDLTDETNHHYSKIGVVRFSPFEKTRGEHSFVVVLLNNNESGISFNFIYTHDGLRVYTKKIKKGKGEGHELTAEEIEAIERSSNI